MTSTPRRSRRSHPNLTHLSLAPLSSKYPLDASTPPSPSSPTAQTPSYIANRSAPTTPGILSLSQSRSTSATRSRRRPKTPTAAFAHDGYFPATPTETPQRAVGEIPKAKSTSVLVPGLSSITTPATLAIAGEGKKRHHLRTRTGGDFRLPTPLQRHHTTHEAADEWLHRAGLAIAGETRESKGQSWLVRRASSTSLVRQSDGWDEHPSHEHEGVQLMKLLSGEHFEGGEAGWVSSPRVLSRFGSRAGSRIQSARGSRRGSRVWGSKGDLGGMTYVPGGGGEEGYFGEEVVEADFVGSDEESVGDEEEVARLARERGFGLGGWMDRLMGWTLFSVEEDGESSDEEGEEEEEALTREEVLLKKEVEAKRRKMERETIIAASAAGSKGKEVENENDVPIPELVPAEGEGGWQDAAWLLSVASKVLL